MIKQHDDDLFQDSVMTFGEHLEELRGCLWRAVLGIVLGFGIGLYFADAVVRFIQSPLEKALQQYYLEDSAEKIRAQNPDVTPEEINLILERNMVFENVFIEPSQAVAALRASYHGQLADVNFPAYEIRPSDILIAAEVRSALRADNPVAKHWRSLVMPAEAPSDDVANANAEQLAKVLNQLIENPKFYDEAAFDGVDLGDELAARLKKRDELRGDDLRLLNWNLFSAVRPNLIKPAATTLAPLTVWRSILDDPRTRSKSLSAQETFMIWLKAALITGIVIASPWVFFQIWSFVAAGLYPKERKFVYVFMPFSIALFLLGAGTAFFFVFEPVLQFFFSFNRSLAIDPDPRISEWLSFVLIMPIGFGLAFQLPLVMLFLERIGVFTVEHYLKQWRISILVIVVVAALLTPADPYSMLFLAVPLVFLFFGGVLLCKWFPRRKDS